MTVSKLTTSTDVYEIQQKTNEIIDGYLPLSGGTLTGSLYFQGASNKNFGFVLNDNNANCDIGWEWSTTAGAGGAFRSVNYSVSSERGDFIIWARSSSGTKKLIGKPSGSLKWDGQDILRANSNLDATKLTGTINTARIPIDNSTITVNGSGKLQATGGSGGDNTFVVTYGVTNYSDIAQAYSDGKLLICIWEDSTTHEKRVTTDLYVGTISSNTAFFFNFVGGFDSFVKYIDSSNQWNGGGGKLEASSNKVTSISSSSTDTKYPSAKCVYDYCQTLKAWCTTKPTTTSSATANNPSVVVSNYLNGTSGYICFSDKLCIQWGHHGNSKTAISLLVTMANTNYALLSTRTASGSGTSYTKTTTTITPGQAWESTWVVIGYHA